MRPFLIPRTLAVLITSLSACTLAPSSPPPHQLAITEQSVWQGSLDLCRTSAQPANDCLINEIKKTGTQEAVIAAQYLAQHGNIGYVDAYKKGKVNVALVTYPFRANTNTGVLLISSDQKIIDVDDIEATIKNDPRWLGVIKKHPDAFTLNTQDAIEFDDRQAARIRLKLTYPIRNCRACEDLGMLSITYTFDDQGAFIARTLSELIMH